MRVNKGYKNNKTPIDEKNREKEVKLPGKSQSMKIELGTKKMKLDDEERDLKGNEE